MKKLLSILLCAALLFGLLPTVAWAEEPATVADFTGDTNGAAALALLNNAKTGTEESAWNSANKTLTLKGVDFNGAVILPDGATIELAEGTTNKISGAKGYPEIEVAAHDAGDSDTNSCGIFALGSLTIQGNGGLEVTAPDDSVMSFGIYASDVTIEGGTVKATGGTAEYGSCGICAAGDYDEVEDIIYGGNVTISGGTVESKGGTATGEASASYGISAYNYVTIEGGTVNATGSTAGDESYGIYAYYGVAISGGTVTATGGEAHTSIGIDTGNVTISGSAGVTAEGGKAAGEESYSCGIYADDATIQGGTVTATGGEAFTSKGIVADNVNISGEATNVTAAGGAAEYFSFGIYSYVSTTISGGHVTARTLAESTEVPAALNMEPTLPAAYWWRTSDSGDFAQYPDVAYTWNKTDTYVEIADSEAVISYPITVESAANGSVTADRDTAAMGDTVTLTVTPAQGYKLEALTVTDAAGKTISVKELGSGKYSFPMPASPVTVKAVFAKAPQPVTNPFVDVKPGTFYYNAVLWAVNNGITRGTTATTFSPDEPCTRAQTVTFLWRAAGCPAPSGSQTPFTDVVPGSFYEKAVQWAVETGITKGTSATTFSPDMTCNRAQIVTFLWRYQGKPAAGSTNPFTDVAANAYYTNAVLWAVENDITRGTTATTFSPDEPCTRAQNVTFLYRCMGN